MNLGLKGKNAVVFAASRGLGKGAALALAAEGARVAICARDMEALNKTAQEIVQATSAEVFAQQADVKEKEQIEKFIGAVAKKWGGVDVLVTNAGGPPVKSFEQTSDEEWHGITGTTLLL